MGSKIHQQGISISIRRTLLGHLKTINLFNLSVVNVKLNKAENYGKCLIIMAVFYPIANLKISSLVKPWFFYLLDYITLSGFSKCGDRKKKTKMKIECLSKMYHIFICPSKLFPSSICCEVWCNLLTQNMT